MTCQASFAIGDNRVRRYPMAIAPFIAVETPDPPAASGLPQLMRVGESLYLVGDAPPLDSAWEVKEHTPIVQMLCPSRLEAGENEVEISILAGPDVPAMLDLTALVYPEFFRLRTLELGAYLGIYQNGRLAAMAGERMYLTGYREISAVCTHPDFIGRGYAACLIRRLVNAILDRNEVPFLHVSRDNERAKSLYQYLGFTSRCELPLWSLKRQR